MPHVAADQSNTASAVHLSLGMGWWCGKTSKCWVQLRLCHVVWPLKSCLPAAPSAVIFLISLVVCQVHLVRIWHGAAWCSEDLAIKRVCPSIMHSQRCPGVYLFHIYLCLCTIHTKCYVLGLSCVIISNPLKTQTMQSLIKTNRISFCFHLGEKSVFSGVD